MSILNKLNKRNTILLIIILVSMTLSYLVVINYDKNTQSNQSIEVSNIISQVKSAPQPKTFMGAEVIESNNPDIIIVRSTKEPYIDPEPSELLRTWLEESGYNLIDLFLPIEIIEAIPDVKLTSDYQSYDMETLKALSDNGDSKATFFYAMNQNGKDQKEAVKAFEKTVIEAGYTASIHQIGLSYNSMAYREKMMAFGGKDDEPTSKLYKNEKIEINSLSENQQNSYSWLLTGVELNDPLSLEILKNISIENLSEDAVVELKSRAVENLNRLNIAREEIGLDNLSTQLLDDDILTFANKRLSD